MGNGVMAARSMMIWAGCETAVSPTVSRTDNRRVPARVAATLPTTTNVFKRPISVFFRFPRLVIVLLSFVFIMIVVMIIVIVIIMIVVIIIIVIIMIVAIMVIVVFVIS